MPDALAAFARDARAALRDGHYARVPADAPGRPGPSLAAALKRAPRGVVAEIKPASPSGALRDVADPEALARAFVAAGARGVSVLTEPRTFRGSLANLVAAARAGGPVLMKDFVVDERQLDAARACGASAVLLILPLHERGDAALGADEAVAAAHARGLETLLEVYDADGLRRALATETDMVAVNNRDLTTLVLDKGRFARVLAGVERDARPLLALSGVEAAADADAAFRAGADAVLVGSALMRAADPASKLKELVG